MQHLELAFDVFADSEALHSSKEIVILVENLFVDYLASEMMMMILEVELSKNSMQQTVAAAAAVAVENDVGAASLWLSDMHRLVAGCWEHDLMVLENVVDED